LVVSSLSRFNKNLRYLVKLNICLGFGQRIEGTRTVQALWVNDNDFEAFGFKVSTSGFVYLALGVIDDNRARTPAIRSLDDIRDNVPTGFSCSDSGNDTDILKALSFGSF
jgi:hypothetical protein